MTLSLARRADRFPDRTAVVDISEERLYAPAETIHERRVSYAGLSELADATAKRLAELGIDAGDTVCLVTRNRVASLALLFACRRLGATFAPISHRLTPVTVERPFEVLEPTLVVAEAAQRDLVRSMPFDRTVTLSELADVDVSEGGDADDGLTTDETTDPRIGDDQSATDDPLLLLHGDGGRPIAEYSARSLEWNCIATLVTWGLSPRDTVPLVSPLSAHDGLVRVALPTLYAGGRLLLDRAFDPGDTLTAIQSEDATLFAGRTAAFRDLAAESGFPEAVDSLERAFPDGSVPEDVLEPYREHGIAVARTYGRLECPIALSQSDTAAASADTDADGLGKPVPDCRVRLVADGSDETDGEPLEDAGTGQLALSGPVVADGYVGDSATDDDGDGETAVDAGFGTGDRTNEKSDDTADRGRFADGWFSTGESFRRDETGRYYRVDNIDNEH
ncbi:class I adenylate-forming enzyme family protein [Halopiger aswanensis]|uniref:Acyl-CoA synthetase (AMP-forming)/AMP-acid ligase II n=1 Tax=Halopiger aswanensis TaxID=148449 RepID=A0A3R7EDT2_9EURY|nr:AMP-binding protein [Halopiger aswanensis]RKD93769.1 acyl-CoA synthetase (AMP-forming)/AMP-acid ligase II [Halopiger aswanensis]